MIDLVWAIAAPSFLAWQFWRNCRDVLDGRVPLAFRILYWLNMALFMAFVCIAFSSQWWAPRTPGPSNPYRVTFRGRHTYFYPTPLGWFMDRHWLWIFVGCGLVLGLMKEWHDARARRASARRTDAA